MLAKVRKELDAAFAARERAVKAQREIIPMCAQAIRDIQKKKYTDAERKLKEVERKIKEVEGILHSYPEVVNSILGPSYQEYAELAIFLSYMKDKKLPMLNVPAKFYLTGLGDAIGELKREGLELLAEHKLKEAEKLADELEDLYFEFSQYVYPNTVVPGLKHKQDIARRVLNDYHNLILSHKLTRP
jgi:translin